MKIYKVDIEIIKFNFPYNFYKNFALKDDALKYANDLYYKIINGKEIVSIEEDKSKGTYRFSIDGVLFRIITEEYTVEDDLSKEKLFISSVENFINPLLHDHNRK